MSMPSFFTQLYRDSIDQYFFNGHFLVKAIYLPRVCAYFIATLITYWGIQLESLNFSQTGLLVFLLIYPHLQFLAVSLRFNSESGARASMFFDGLMVGVLIVANHFHFIASISFLASLSMSTLIIARYPIVLANLVAALIVCSLGYGLNIDSGLVSQSDGKETAAAAMVLVYSALVAVLGYRTTMSLGEKRKQLFITSREMTSISEKLKRYVSPQIYFRIANRDHEQSARKCLTVFFSDIEGFTELMDSLEEETVTRILNEYLNSMAEIAIKHGGTIDKFMGDGIMVFFGDPATKGQYKDALACIEMALTMREKVKLLRLKWSSEGIFSDLHVRIGIHTGFCTVGNFGCESRMDYTAVGSTVNLASRLEGKAMQDGILISGDTYKLVHREVRVLHRDPVYLKGIKRGVETHDVLGFDRKNERGIDRQAAGFTLSLDPTLMDCDEVKSMLQETITTIEAIEARRLEKAVVLQILNRAS